METREQPPCDHIFEDDPWTPGIQVCTLCPETREAPVTVEVPSQALADAMRRAA